MKKCKEILENGNKTGVKDEGLLFAVCDLLCNLKCKSQWEMMATSIILTLCIFFGTDLTECRIEKVSSLFLSVFSSTIGMTIAAYAIIIGFTPDALNKSEMTAKESKSFHVICASMIFNGIIQLLTILIVFAFLYTNCRFCFYMSTCLSCLSILQMLDIMLQLLALRTFKYRFQQNDYMKSKKSDVEK